MDFKAAHAAPNFLGRGARSQEGVDFYLLSNPLLNIMKMKFLLGTFLQKCIIVDILGGGTSKENSYWLLKTILNTYKSLISVAVVMLEDMGQCSKR